VNTDISDSHRNWPSHLGEIPESFAHRTAQVVRKKHKRALLRSTDPLDVAQMILDGIRDRKFWIFTDDTYAINIRDRVQGAVAGDQPVAPRYA
jgi:methyl coenzyme M reductase subunit C